MDQVTESYRTNVKPTGDKIQIYNSDGVLVKTFESLVDSTRDNEFVPGATKNMIALAIDNKTMYKKYRWLRLERSLPNDTVQVLGKTTKSKTLQIGDVAMFNKEKIEMVFCDQKAAAENRGFSIPAITKAIKMSTLSGGHYFKYWFDCDTDDKEDYLARGGVLPEKRVRANALQIQKLHPKSGDIIHMYTSIQDVVKEYRMTRATLKKASDQGSIACDYKWHIME